MDRVGRFGYRREKSVWRDRAKERPEMPAPAMMICLPERKEVEFGGLAILRGFWWMRCADVDGGLKEEWEGKW
jgi:hypothetical protein